MSVAPPSTDFSTKFSADSSTHSSTHSSTNMQVPEVSTHRTKGFSTNEATINKTPNETSEQTSNKTPNETSEQISNKTPTKINNPTDLKLVSHTCIKVSKNAELNINDLTFASMVLATFIALSSLVLYGLNSSSVTMNYLVLEQIMSLFIVIITALNLQCFLASCFKTYLVRCDMQNDHDALIIKAYLATLLSTEDKRLSTSANAPDDDACSVKNSQTMSEHGEASDGKSKNNKDTQSDASGASTVDLVAPVQVIM